MIQVTRINHSTLVLNSDLIEQIQATPDTVVTLTSGRNYMVLESPEEIIRRVVEFKKELFCNAFRCPVERSSNAGSSEGASE